MNDEPELVECPRCHGDGTSFWFPECQRCKGEVAVVDVENKKKRAIPKKITPGIGSSKQKT